MELLIISVFTIILILFVIFKISIVYALIIGLFLFSFYAKVKGFKIKEIFRMWTSGLLTIKNILLTFILIGILTALWRTSGCIPSIIVYSSRFVSPSLLVLITFLLNAFVSTLIGTAFGTATTVGVICASMAKALGVPLMYIGGAILSGAYFGDRISPVSTSALLVSTLTETDIYINIKNMIKSCIVPLFISCLLFYLVGSDIDSNVNVSNMTNSFSDEFNISLFCLIPALLIIVFSFFKFKVKTLLTISIISTIPISIFIQNVSFFDILKDSLLGFNASSFELSTLIDGGGIFSMFKVSLIIAIASSYSGIFKETGLLNFLDKYTKSLQDKFGSYFVYLICSILLTAVSCNQTLSIILTDQVVSKVESDKEKCALYLEDSSVIIAPLIPWAIASTMPLTTAGCPTISIIFAFYLYILPIYSLIRNRK